MTDADRDALKAAATLFRGTKYQFPERDIVKRALDVIDRLVVVVPTQLDLNGLENHACSSGTSTSPKVRDQILAACAEIRRLETRVQELLVTIRRLTNETPLPEEIEGWESQRAALLVEIGSVRAQLAESQRREGRCSTCGIPKDGAKQRNTDEESGRMLYVALQQASYGFNWRERPGALQWDQLGPNARLDFMRFAISMSAIVLGWQPL